MPFAVSVFHFLFAFFAFVPKREKNVINYVIISCLFEVNKEKICLLLEIISYFTYSNIINLWRATRLTSCHYVTLSVVSHWNQESHHRYGHNTCPFGCWENLMPRCGSPNENENWVDSISYQFIKWFSNYDY